MMVLMSISAVVLAVAAAANQGGKYATAAALGLGFLAIVFVTLAIVFLLSWCVANLRRPIGLVLIVYAIAMVPLAVTNVQLGWLNAPVTIACTFFVGLFLMVVRPPKDAKDKITSPFAVDHLPPQILPPRDPLS